MNTFINMNFLYEAKKVKLSKEQTNKHFKICDSVFFIDCVTDDITLGNLIDIMPFVDFMVCERKLNLNRPTDFKIAKNYLFKAVKSN